MSATGWPGPIPRSRWWTLAMPIALLAAAASFYGMRNGFTYDDVFIVLDNEIVHDLKRAWRFFLLPYWPIRLGGDGYRPLTLLGFAVQWAIAPGSAMFFHAVSVALYVATSVAVFRLASLLLPIAFAWLTAALFAVHPVHVEAVASVVGQAELWAGLLLLSATAFYIEWRRAGAFGTGRKAVIALLYFAACLFKEHAIVLPLALLAAEWLVVGDPQPLGARLRSLRPWFLCLVIVGSTYLLLRSLVIGKSLAGFAPFMPFISLRVGHVDRVLTMLGVVPEWLRLLVWPAKLTSEYGPPANPIAQGFELWQLSGALLLFGVLGLGAALRKRFPVASFGIIWAALMLLPSSNLLVASGVLLAERTMFAGSLGALLAVCAVLPLAVHQARTPLARVLGMVAVGTVLILGVARSIVRSADWRTNGTLFTAAVKTEPMAYRAHYILGAWLMGLNHKTAGEREYLIAMSLFPHDPAVAYNLAQEYFAAGLYEDAYRMFDRANQIIPAFEDVHARMALTRAAQGQYPEARALATLAVRDGVGDKEMLTAILAAEPVERLVVKLRASPVVSLVR